MQHSVVVLDSEEEEEERRERIQLNYEVAEVASASLGTRKDFTLRVLKLTMHGTEREKQEKASRYVARYFRVRASIDLRAGHFWPRRPVPDEPVADTEVHLPGVVGAIRSGLYDHRGPAVLL